MCFLSVTSDTEAGAGSESTSVRGISEDRDTVVSWGLQKNALPRTNFLETCQLQKHQEVSTVKNVTGKVPRIHGDRKPFRCEVCGKGFSYFCHYVQHQRIRTGRNLASVMNVEKLLLLSQL